MTWAMESDASRDTCRRDQSRGGPRQERQLQVRRPTRQSGVCSWDLTRVRFLGGTTGRVYSLSRVTNVITVSEGLPSEPRPLGSGCPPLPNGRGSDEPTPCQSSRWIE